MDSKNAGKSSFAFAWVLDGTAEERERCASGAIALLCWLTIITLGA